MRTHAPPSPQSYYHNKLSEIEQKITEKSGDSVYLYRGEPEFYKEEPFRSRVSSTLYRLAPNEFDSEQFNVKLIQDAKVQEVRTYIHEYQKKEFELLTELQHYGSDTNLIDFTTDYRIALFFACYGSHDKNGRVILLRRTSDTIKKYQIQKPQSPQNRILSQKSIFVQPPQGFIDFKDLSTICVPQRLKQWILIHLQRFQDISTQSIYNDLHGYIRDRAFSGSQDANLPHFLASRAKTQALANPSSEDYNDLLQQAIDSYSAAIENSPYDSTIYLEQGQCYLGLRDYDRAIETFSKSILLSPNYAYAFRNRAQAYLANTQKHFAIADYTKAIDLGFDDGRCYYDRGIIRILLREWSEAKKDLETAREKGEDIVAQFNNTDMRPKVFFEKFNISDLPNDIASMLQPG